MLIINRKFINKLCSSTLFISLNVVFAATSILDEDPVFKGPPAFIGEDPSSIKPNVMFMLDVTGSMGAWVSGSSNSRIQIARSVIANVIRDSSDNLRVGFGFFPVFSYKTPNAFGTLARPGWADAPTAAGLASWSGQPFHSRIDMPIRDINQVLPSGLTQRQTLINRVSNIQLYGDITNPSTINGYYTSMASAVAEITRYYRGINPMDFNIDPRRAINIGVSSLTAANTAATLGTFTADPDLATGPIDTPTYVSPIQYACQRNYAVIVTDGEEPWYFPWIQQDGLFSSKVNSVMRPDGTNYMVPRSVNEGPAVSAAAFTNRVLNNIITGVDGFVFDRMAQDYPIMTTHTVGFGQAVPLSREIAMAGGGDYYDASNAAALTASLNQIFANIAKPIFPPNTTPVFNEESTSAVEVKYDARNWTATILVNEVLLDGQFKEGGQKPVVFSLTSNQRQLFTDKGTANTSVFERINQGSNINQATTDTAQTDIYGAMPYTYGISKFLAGFEPIALPGGQLGVTNYRQRPQPNLAALCGSNVANCYSTYAPEQNVMGDVINSTPLIYEIDEAKFLLVGTNSGGLHIFKWNGSTPSTSITMPDTNNYHELLSYMPRTTLENVAFLMKDNYGINSKGLEHRYFVDGNMIPSEGKVFTALGRGGRGIFALDLNQIITSQPDSLIMSNQQIAKVGMWEVNSSSPSLTNLGHVTGKLVVAPTILNGENKNAVITGNGYLTATTSLFVLDAATGAFVSEQAVNNNGRQGLSSPAVVDLDGDDVADHAFAGDLNGNLWLFDLINGKAPIKFYEGTSTQPIYGRPRVVKNNDQYMVIFGTGVFLNKADYQHTDVQSVYGLIFDPSNPSYKHKYSARASDLLKQEIIRDVVQGEETFRSVSSNPITASQHGWYLDLPTNSKTGAEKVNSDIEFINGRIIFNSRYYALSGGILSGNVCEPSEQSSHGWIYALDPLTGANPDNSYWNFGEGIPDGLIDFGGKTKTPPAAVKVGSEGSISVGYSRESGTTKNSIYTKDAQSDSNHQFTNEKILRNDISVPLNIYIGNKWLKVYTRKVKAEPFRIYEHKRF